GETIGPKLFHVLHRLGNDNLTVAAAQVGLAIHHFVLVAAQTDKRPVVAVPGILALARVKGQRLDAQVLRPLLEPEGRVREILFGPLAEVRVNRVILFLGLEGRRADGSAQDHQIVERFALGPEDGSGHYWCISSWWAS